MTTPPSAPLLRMSQVSKRFGATLALRNVSLELGSGEVLALLGENGAGKSTLMKVLSGAHPPDSGAIELAGKPYTPGSPSAARLAGIGMIYQELNLATELSVEDNIMLGQEQSRLGLLRRRRQRARVSQTLDILGHPELRPQTRIAHLSPGARQLVEIARALVMEARVLVFDEPTSSLTAKDVERLFTVIRKLRADGRGIIYISHFLEEVREICDRYTVLRDGEVAGSGVLSGVTEAQIVSLMVGRSVDHLFPTVPHSPGEVVLSLQGLSGLRIPQHAGFKLRRGEILGIAGLVGSGRTELLRCLYGLDPVVAGTVSVRNVSLSGSPERSIKNGLGFVSEDRKGEGLSLSQSIADNLTASLWRPYSLWGWLRLGKRRQKVAEWMQKLKVKAQSPEQSIHELSGGNQQKVAIARVLHQAADILLLDEPTRGIDIGTKAEVYQLLGNLAAQGKAIVFVSSYLPELLNVCDRIGVMSRGRLVDLRDTKDWTEETILACALGTETSLDS